MEKENEEMDDGTEAGIVKGFSAIKLHNVAVRDDAWVLYKDASESEGGPKAITRKRYMDQNKGEPPKNKVFERNSYAIHASLTNNEELKVNGKFGEHDYMPPHTFFKMIQLSKARQGRLNSGEKDFDLRLEQFKEIAGDIGIPARRAKYIKHLEDDEQVYNTGGGTQFCTIKYDNQRLAGYNIPNIQIWVGSEIKRVAWHTKDGTGEYDGISFDELKAKVKEQFPDATIALKSNTNRTMGTEQLDQYKNGAVDRWANQVGDAKVRNQHFNHLTAVIPIEDGLSENYSLKWIALNVPNVMEKFQRGEMGHHLRVIASGNARTTVQFAMERFPQETKKLLKEAGIPFEIADKGPVDDQLNAKVGKVLPSVSVPLADHKDGAPPEGEDVMKKYNADSILIANVGANGEPTGYQRTLSEYQIKKLPLPVEAAEELGIEPDEYSRSGLDQRTRETAYASSF